MGVPSSMSDSSLGVSAEMTWTDWALFLFWIGAGISATLLYVKVLRPQRIRDAQLQSEVHQWGFNEIAQRANFVLLVINESLATQMDRYYPSLQLLDTLRRYDWGKERPLWEPSSWNRHSLSACLNRLEAQGFVTLEFNERSGINSGKVRLTGSGMNEAERLMDGDEREPRSVVSVGNITNSQVVISGDNVRQSLRDAQFNQAELDPGVPLLIEQLLQELETGNLEIEEPEAQELASEVQHVADVAAEDGMSQRLKRGLRSLAVLVGSAAQSAVRDELVQEIERVLNHANWLTS